MLTLASHKQSKHFYLQLEIVFFWHLFGHSTLYQSNFVLYHP